MYISFYDVYEICESAYKSFASIDQCTMHRKACIERCKPFCVIGNSLGISYNVKVPFRNGVPTPKAYMSVSDALSPNVLP